MFNIFDIIDTEVIFLKVTKNKNGGYQK